jgi:hypothetical protein
MLRAMDLPDPERPLMITMCMSMSIAERGVHQQAGLA